MLRYSRACSEPTVSSVRDDLRLRDEESGCCG